MKALKSTFTFILLILISVSLSMCTVTNDDPEEAGDELKLQIVNSTTYDTTDNNLIYGDITVKLIPDTENVNFEGSTEIVDFGTLAISKASELKVAPTTFKLEVNGVIYGDGDNSSFGISDQPTGEWLLELQGLYQRWDSSYALNWSMEAIF